MHLPKQIPGGLRLLEVRNLHKETTEILPEGVTLIGLDVPQNETWMIQRVSVMGANGNAGGVVFVAAERPANGFYYPHVRDTFELTKVDLAFYEFAYGGRDYAQPVVLQGGQRLDIGALTACDRMAISVQLAIYRVV